MRHSRCLNPASRGRREAGANPEVPFRGRLLFSVPPNAIAPSNLCADYNGGRYKSPNRPRLPYLASVSPVSPQLVAAN